MSSVRFTKGETDSLFIKTRGNWVRLKYDEIDLVVAEPNSSRIQAGSESYSVRDAVAAIAAKLPADRFAQINRATILNIERVRAIHSKSHGDAIAELEGGERLTITRRFRPKLRFLFEGEEPARRQLNSI
jgi:DNA-binding LytR/AlgR family response regulator